MAIERSILETAAGLRQRREPHLLATVVRTCGATYRRIGARMLLTQFRWIGGAASGGLLGGDLASQGWARTRDGEAVVITFDSRTPSAIDEDVRCAFGLGAEGTIDVLVERAGVHGRIDPLAFAAQCLHEQRRGALVTVIGSEAPGVPIGARIAVMDQGAPVGDKLAATLKSAMIADARGAVATGESRNRTYRTELGNVDVFVEAIAPPPRVFIFGTGHDAIALVDFAKRLGWDSVVCTDEDRVAVRHRFADATEILVGTPEEIAARIDACERPVAALMGHDHELDRAYLGMLVGTYCRYIGVLGPRTRTHRMLAELGLGIDDDARIHAPAGLDIAADTPHEVALAIGAQIQAVLARAPAAQPRTVAPRTARTVGSSTTGTATGTMKRIRDRIDALVPVAS